MSVIFYMEWLYDFQLFFSTSPAVSIPNDNGATSSNNISSALSSPDVLPDKIADCTEAP